MSISREEAKSQELNRYLDDKPCKKGHISEKYVRDGYCCECKYLNEIKHKESRTVKSKKRYICNSKSIIIRNQEYAIENKEIVRVRQLAWRQRNKNKIVKYRQDNAGLYAFFAAERRVKVKRATPPWADMNKIKWFYLEAARITKETGVTHEVDHIVPLTNKIVSGLHCEFNLQILTKTENIRKHNHFIA